MNGVSFRGDYNAPILLLANTGNDSYPYDPEVGFLLLLPAHSTNPFQWNVYNFGSNSSVRFIINNPTVASHPIHLHGHNFFVLAAGAPGAGNWPGGALTNPHNPQRRDVQVVPANSYIVLQMTSDNPGAWPLHCHIAWHVSAGLYLTVLERPADIKNLKIPSIMAQTCREWSTFTNTTIPDQIDSGLWSWNHSIQVSFPPWGIYVVKSIVEVEALISRKAPFMFCFDFVGMNPNFVIQLLPASFLGSWRHDIYYLQCLSHTEESLFPSNTSRSTSTNGTLIYELTLLPMRLWEIFNCTKSGTF
jgi:hypothetical protein